MSVRLSLVILDSSERAVKKFVTVTSHRPLPHVATAVLTQQPCAQRCSELILLCAYGSCHYRPANGLTALCLSTSRRRMWEVVRELHTFYRALDGPHAVHTAKCPELCVFVWVLHVCVCVGFVSVRLCVFCMCLCGFVCVCLCGFRMCVFVWVLYVCLYGFRMCVFVWVL